MRPARYEKFAEVQGAIDSGSCIERPQRSACSEDISAAHEIVHTLCRQPDLGCASTRVEHNTHSRQVRGGKPISTLNFANSEQLARLVIAEVHDDHRGRVVELRRGDGQWFAQLVVIDEQSAEEGCVHLEAYNCPIECVFIQSQCCLDMVPNLLLVHGASANALESFLGFSRRTSCLCRFVLGDLAG